MTDRTATERLDSRTRIALVAMSLAVFVIANDITSLSVALPSIEHEFGVDVETVQWVMNAYTLVFGVLIVTGGRLSDMLGRRRTFFIGVTIFALFSAVGAVAGSTGVLIGARAAMAVGAALIWPSVVGLIFGPVPAARAGLAGGLLLGVSGIGNALGPMVGGLLTDQLSWRWILVLNLPIAAAAIVLVARYVDRDAVTQTRERLDWLGVATLSIGLVTLLVALDQAADWGWGDPRIIGLLAIGVTSLVTLVFTSKRTRCTHTPGCDRHPGVRGRVRDDRARLRHLVRRPALRAAVHGEDPGLLRSGGRGRIPADAGSVLRGCLRSGPGLQPVRSASPAGVRSRLHAARRTAPQHRRRELRVSGDGAWAGGDRHRRRTLLLDRHQHRIDLPGPSRTGVGSGLTFMFQLVGGAVGVGIATAVFTRVSRSHLGPREGFVAGLHAGLRVEAAIALCGLVTVWQIVRAPRAPRAAGMPEPAR